MRTAFTGNMDEEVFNVVIVNLRFVILLFFKYQFRHRYRFKSIGLAPVSERNQTIPIPSHTTQSYTVIPARSCLRTSACITTPKVSVCVCVYVCVCVCVCVLACFHQQASAKGNQCDV